MNDCEWWGVKHKFKFDYATDNFLLGNLYFSCERCATRVIVDRLYFYLTLRPEGVKRRSGY
jgi:hypothetical protein